MDTGTAYGRPKPSYREELTDPAGVAFTAADACVKFEAGNWLEDSAETEMRS